MEPDAIRSNCFIQAIKGRVKTQGKAFLVIPKRHDEKGMPHFIWSDGNGYKHFTFKKKRRLRWFQLLFFKGHVEDFPNEFLKHVTLKEIF